MAQTEITEEQTPEALGVILKDRDGDDRVYYGVEAVKLVTTDGGTQLFSKGETIEGVPIVPDFSGGDMAVRVPEGKLAKSAVIEKPETLIPENIAEGVDIAGIIGTFAGGEGNVKIAGGSFAGTSGQKVVTHNLGAIPDVFVAFCSNPQPATGSGCYVAYIGLSSAFGAKCGFAYNVWSAKPSSASTVQYSRYTSSLDNSPPSRTFPSVTESAITVGSTYEPTLSSSYTYSWFAISGIV